MELTDKEILGDFKSYVTELLDMLEVVGYELQRLCVYMQLFPTEKRLYDLVYAAFTHTLSFLTMANQLFKSNG